MKVDGKHMRTIWVEADRSVGIIDQTLLPHRFETRRLNSLADAAHAIKSMQVRGAPLIGAAAVISASAQARLIAVGRVAASSRVARARLWSDVSARSPSAIP